MGELTIVLDDATAAELHAEACSAGVSECEWLAGLVRSRFRAGDEAAILIVDDEPVFREVLRCRAEGLGWSADVAENGAEALALLAERRYRLLLTDRHMPVMDGLQLVHALRARERRRGEPPLPVVLVSAEPAPVDAASCRVLAIDECLLKPPAEQALSRIFGRWLGAAAHAGKAAAGGG
ncbi:MAG: response regulator [Azospira sp.]|nr:response regulator [Azospira sp.]